MGRNTGCISQAFKLLPKSSGLSVTEFFTACIILSIHPSIRTQDHILFIHHLCKFNHIYFPSTAFYNCPGFKQTVLYLYHSPNKTNTLLMANIYCHISLCFKFSGMYEPKSFAHQGMEIALYFAKAFCLFPDLLF